MDVKAILALPEVNGDMNKALAYMSRQLTEREAELKTAKLGMAAKLTIKVGEKGTVSVYGLGRFPVSLYREQWLRLLESAENIKAFIAANGDRLKVKGETTTTPATGTDGK
jgi:hypothetical protein